MATISVEIASSMFAASRRLTLSVRSDNDQLVVEADRQILAAAITNLLQNAFKFTRWALKRLPRYATICGPEIVSFYVIYLV
ncbi:MAG TPA: hypothetical protein VER96_17330 [Polyangiaceae bacterium]|nr:hypothetical protein [Polyangiaceae bacterium]